MVISESFIHTNVRSKTQILKIATTLKQFSSKIKNAQDEEVLTPETVKEIAEEIKEVAEVATELAEEISEGVPAEEGNGERREENGEPEQIEVAADEDDEEKKRREREKEAADDDDDDDKKDMREEVASLKTELKQIKRASKLEQLAGKYASFFPTTMKEAKMNEILKSKQPLEIIQARVQEASDIITNKTMVKVASLTDSIYDLTDSSEEVNIASKL